MKFVFYTVCISPHQLPLAREIARRTGEDGYRYVYAKPLDGERRTQGWSDSAEPWLVRAEYGDGTADDLLETCETLMCGLRDVTLMERRGGRRTLYCSERWFKPPLGFLRLLHPGYFRMARRFVKLLRRRDGLVYLPMGVHAARDMARLCGLFSGDLRCLFRAPALECDKRPGGRIRLRGGGDGARYGLDAMRMWGYFVAPSASGAARTDAHAAPGGVRVLWAGRMLDWKRVETIVRAVRAFGNGATLDIYGFGPEEKRLKRLASGCGDRIRFHGPVPIEDVRGLMRTHDVYVLSSDGGEGWGAVVNEALEEGMRVIGTYEAGASATMLPDSCLYHAGDWKRLTKMLKSHISKTNIGAWCAARAAEALVANNKMAEILER